MPALATAAMGLEYWQISPLNKGDKNIGLAAARIGYEFARGEINGIQVYSRIMDMCKPR